MSSFKQDVEALVAQIPEGRVMTYGQIASIVGRPMAARQVGGVAHFGSPDLPWHRVVNARGGLASGYPGGRKAHSLHLKAENIIVIGIDNDYRVDLDTYLWLPEEKQT